MLEVEELHVWGLSASRTALNARVVIDPQPLESEALSRDQLLALARTRLAELGIHKSTLQPETSGQAEWVQIGCPSPSMPDQELLDDFLQALEQTDSPVKNPVLRQRLGWDEATYESVKAQLVAMCSTTSSTASPSRWAAAPRRSSWCSWSTSWCVSTCR